MAGAPAGPAIRFDLEAAQVTAPQTREAGLPPLSVALSGDVADSRIRFDAQITGVQGLALNATGLVDPAAGPGFDLRLSGPVPVDLARARLAAAGLSLSGLANLDATMRGTAAAPVVSGTIRLANGRLVSIAGALDIRDLDVELGLAGDVLRVNRMVGQMASGGTLSGSGTVSLVSDRGYEGSLALRVANGRYSDGRLVAARYSADLAITGPLARDPLIGGRIDLSSVVVTAPDSLPRAVSTLDIQRKNASDAVLAQDERLARSSTSGDGGVRLALTVAAPSSILVRGRGIDARLGGALQLNGRSSAPNAVGGFDLESGTVDLAGRKLRFTSGTLSFTGSLTPFADLLATASAQSSTVSVRVFGPVDALEFGFSSVPDLPEDEVLALLVFGRSLANLSPLQIAQLAQSVARLTGVTRGPGLLERLSRASGIDSLDVETNEQTGDTSVAVGKALNERTQVNVVNDAAGTRARIDLEIGRGVRLRGEADTGGSAKGGIFFEREY